MARPESSIDDIAPSVQDQLGVAEGLLDGADPIAIMRSLRHALTRVALRPQATIPAFARFGARLATAGVDVAVRTLGSRLAEPVAVEAKDSRFRDPAWAQNPMFRLLLEWYLATTKLLLELVEGADLDDAIDFGLGGLLAFREDDDAHGLAEAVRQRHGAADVLVGLPGVDSEVHGEVDGRVEQAQPRRLDGAKSFG